jgi:hypothetical protein
MRGEFFLFVPPIFNSQNKLEMNIIWMDSKLQRHVIDLSDAVDVKINGIRIGISSSGKGLQISAERYLIINPKASNVIDILGEH